MLLIAATSIALLRLTSREVPIHHHTWSLLHVIRVERLPIVWVRVSSGVFASSEVVVAVTLLTEVVTRRPTTFHLIVVGGLVIASSHHILGRSNWPTDATVRWTAHGSAIGSLLLLLLLVLRLRGSSLITKAP
jgi:hypothetical protein